MQFTSGSGRCCLKLLKEQSRPPDNGRIFANVQYTKLGHGCFRDYVNDYYRNLQARRQTNLPSDATSTSKMTRLTKVTRLNTVAGVVERPLKRIYKSRPIFNKSQ